MKSNAVLKVATRLPGGNLAARAWLVLLLAAPLVAHAQGLPTKPTEVMNALAALAIGLGTAIVTIGGVAVFSKMGFGKAQWADTTNVIWSGVGIGTIAAFAAYMLA